MATILEFRQMGEFIRGISGKMRRASARALFRTVQAGSNLAKKNARDNFKGTRDRPKTGALVAAIFPGFTLRGQGKNKEIAQGYVAVRSHKGNQGTKPYGRIKEFGGTIRPVRANYLWIPLFGPKTRFPGSRQFHTMTPTKFIQGMEENKGDVDFFITPGHHGKVAGIQYVVGGRRASPRRKVAGLGGTIRKVGAPMGTLSLKTIPLFALKTIVKQKPNPYVTPAVAVEFGKFGQRIDEELARSKKIKDGGNWPPEKG